MAIGQTMVASQLTSPAWAGDDLGGENLVPGGAKVTASAFPVYGAVSPVVGVAGAAALATSVPVAALSGPIPSGTVLDFGGAKFAVLTADAASGATALTVRALVTALVSGDTATYNGTGKRTIRAGTAIGRTIAERDANTPYGPAADTDDEIYLVAFDVTDADQNNDVELYRHNRTVWENYLPVFSTLSATIKAYIRANYECSIAVN